MANIHEKITALWDKAIGTPTYVKQEWVDLANMAPQWISVADWISTTHKTAVLAAFEGQFGWVIFTAFVTTHHGIRAAGYDAPTHWMPLPEPPITCLKNEGKR